MWLCRQPVDALTEAEVVYRREVLAGSPVIQRAYTLTTEFLQLVSERARDRLPAWLAAAHDSGILELQRFARGLERDRAAVDAGLALEWSNGQVEGQVNRLKMVKRQMFGRASFALLRHRLLAP